MANQKNKSRSLHLNTVMSRMFKITAAAFEITKSGSISNNDDSAICIPFSSGKVTPELIVSSQNMFKINMVHHLRAKHNWIILLN